ncbi:MAG: FAD-dependent oxidoreductase [Deferribacterales bacterium]
MGLKIVVIGGVAAGATAAVKARRMDETAEITILEKNNYVSFANCGMPYYIGDTIRSRNSLIFHNAKSFKQRFNINVYTKTEARSIDPDKKLVYAIKDGEEITFKYDKLILCNGAKTVLPPIEGINSVRYHTLRSIEDMDGIKETIKSSKVKTATIIGAGFIGVEIAEALHNLGIDVKMVEATPFILPMLSPEVSLKIYEEMTKAGIEILTSCKIIKADSNHDGKIILTDNNNNSFTTELLIIATGVKPDTDLAKTAGIKIGVSGGIEVNCFMETSVKDIYAAGDITEKINLITGKKTLAPLAGPANREGRVAGSNAVGFKKEYKGTLKTAIVSFGKACCAQTGLSYEEAIKEGFDPHVVYTEDPDHVTYYPGAKYIFLKLIFDKKDGRILGAQASGEEGVARRIDVLATAIYNKMTVYDLEDLDLSYSPPYGAAKDPVNISGYVASNLLRCEVKAVTPEEFLNIFQNNQDLQILDVRSQIEYKTYKVKNSINIYVNNLREYIDQLNKNLPVYIYCTSGYRSYLAAKILSQYGFEAYNILGGIEAIVRFNKIKKLEVIDGSNS